MSSRPSGVDDSELRDLIRQAIAEALTEPTPKLASAGTPGSNRTNARGEGNATRPATRHGQPPLPPHQRPDSIDRIRRSSPSRLVQGRTGTRYLTDSYVGLRADHAIAIDAVQSELPEDFAAQHGMLFVRSRCSEHQEFLLYPDHGRRLSDDSKKLLATEGEKGSDITIIAGDGLSAMALIENGPPLVAALIRELGAAGFRVGRPLAAKFARVGLQDDVGVLLQSRATIILVGERPGLGTGDSLSIYTAYGPKLNQDNSEKDCISNVRDLGLSPDEAARRCTELMKRTFAAQGGGIKLVGGE